MSDFIIVPFETRHIASVRSLNAALRKGNAGFEFPDSPIDDEWPEEPGRPVFRKRFLAVDHEGVHGGYMLKLQKFRRGKSLSRVGQYALPLSRVVVDPRYRAVGGALLRDVLQRQPRLYVMGMGGLNRRLPRQLRKAGFELRLIPFYFKIINAENFLSEIRYLRKSRALARLLDVVRGYGVVSGFLKAHDLVAQTDATATLVKRFGPWADRIWKRTRAAYSFLGVRDSETLNTLFSDPKRYLRLRIRSKGKTVGWALLVDTRMSDNAHFGNMRVGTLVDALALPGFEPEVARAAARFLAKRGVDLIVSNQSHRSWRKALLAAAFLRGPSNYGFAASPKLALEIPAFEECHFTRGDGSGPIRL